MTPTEDRLQHEQCLLRDDLTRLTGRVDDLCTKMNAFREEATRLLQEMAVAHAPKGEDDGNRH